MVIVPSQANIKCIYGTYGDYGYCRGGVKTKYRPLVGGDPVTCTELTRTQPCQDCQLTDWYNVGGCVDGHQRRRRDKLNDPVNGGAKCSLVRDRVITCGGSPNINAYSVGEGRFWYTSPPAMTCLEACAYNFGGVPSDYRCSTRSDVITDLGYYDHMYLDTDGDNTYCPQRVPEMRREPIYNCDDEGCSVSAYVNDHRGCVDKVNYCWSNVATH